MPQMQQGSRHKHYHENQMSAKPFSSDMSLAAISAPLTPHSLLHRGQGNKKSNTYELCNNASRISISVNPFLTAPLICVPNSVNFPCAVSMPMTNRLLSRNARPGLVHNDPQAASYIYHSHQYIFFFKTPPDVAIQSHKQ